MVPNPLLLMSPPPHLHRVKFFGHQTFWETPRQPKITYLDFTVLCYKNIGTFDITVHNVGLMDKRNGTQHVVNDFY